MFNVSTTQKQYLTYILEDTTTNSSLEIVPERGGIATKWSVEGQDIFYLDEERFKDPNLSVRGGNPILFPICGNIVDDTYTYNSQEYKLKQHGFARNLPWTVVSQSTEDSAKITFSLASNEETLKVFPFEFEIIYTYELKGNILTLHQSYSNKSEQRMPFSFGFHPYFICSDKEQLTLDFPATEYQWKDGNETIAFDGELDYNLDEIDIAFTKLSGSKASFTDGKRNLKVDLDFSDCFSTLVFWTLKGKDFICVEPWSSPRNSMNTGDNLLFLPPQETYNATFSIVVSNK